MPETSYFGLVINTKNGKVYEIQETTKEACLSKLVSYCLFWDIDRFYLAVSTRYTFERDLDACQTNKGFHVKQN